MRKYKFMQARPNGLSPIEFSYRGFDARVTPTTELIAVVFHEGEHFLYALDDDHEAVQNLQLYLRDSDVVQTNNLLAPITVYRRVPG